MNNRNAIKYKSFDALEGYKESIEAIHNKRLLVERPTPSEDDEERINEVLQIGLFYKKTLNFTIFKKGIITYIEGIINNFNNNQKKLTLEDGTYIYIEDLINVEQK